MSERSTESGGCGHANAVAAQLALADQNDTLPDDMEDDYSIQPAQEIPCPLHQCDQSFSTTFAADRHLNLTHGDRGRYVDEQRERRQSGRLLPDGGQQQTAMKKVGFRIPKGLHGDLEKIAEQPGSHFENKSDAIRTAIMRFVREEQARQGGGDD